MGQINLGYSFYRKVENVPYLDFGRDILSRLENVKVSSEGFFNVPSSLKCTFKTIYPGMALGLGYAHDISDKDDYKLGFTFDYTTGLPYIPGSSIKGTIRSMFPLDENDTERINIINSFLEQNFDYHDIYELEKLIFGKSTNDTASTDNAHTKDIFHDGYFGTSSGGFLSSDYITPHKDEITSPDPLKFLKISPDVKVILQFSLTEKDIDIGGKKFTQEERIKLYISILKWTGLGAKTNVGYGMVSDVKFEKDNISTNDIEDYFEQIKKNNKDKEDEGKTPEQIRYKSIKEKFDLLDINDKEKVKEFVTLFQKDPLAKEMIKELIEVKEFDFKDTILKEEKYRQLEKKLKNFLKKEKRVLTEDEKNALENHLLTKMEKNNRHFPYAVLNDDKVFGKVKTAKIKDNIDNNQK